MRTSLLVRLLLLFVPAAAVGEEARLALPGTGPLPDGLGTNIHFTTPQPGEMKMLAEGGFRWLRMDFVWGRIERTRGVYDWSAYDRLVKAGEPHGMRFLFILDYSNQLYESERSVRTAAGRAAFARWAAAAVKRYKGRGILWEMWNEPNLDKFWGPEATTQDYIRLAKAVGQGIRTAAPKEYYIGPGTSGIPMDFLAQCFQAGLLEYWCAVSVHPYRQSPPETVAEDYCRLRALLRRYAPKGKHLPILSGEWGYSAAWNAFDREKQGRYLPRQWLTNLANDVPLSIWYDWHDDGRDPKEAEHHFGTVRNPVHKGRNPVYDPKPAYLAARTLTTVLKGFRFNKRLAVGPPDDVHVLLLSRGNDVRLAVWAESPEPRDVILPASPGRFRVTAHTGRKLPDVAAGAEGLKIRLTDAPIYLAPGKPNDLLRVAAAWERVPLEVLQRGGSRATYAHRFRNPLDRAVVLGALEVGAGQEITLPLTLRLRRRAEPEIVRLDLDVRGTGRVSQWMRIVVTNPLDVVVRPAAGKALRLTVRNPSGEPLDGRIAVTAPRGIVPAGDGAMPLRLAENRTRQEVHIPLAEQPGRSYTFGLRITDAAGEAQLELAPMRLVTVDDFAVYTPETLGGAYRLVADGDTKVSATQSVSLGEPKDGPPLPGVKCLRVRYNIARGWKFIRLAPRRGKMKGIEGKPKRLGLWLRGDASGHSPRLRFRDKTGQTFQPTGEAIRWKGWRYITLSMDGRRAGHWGGANDGIVHYPIEWDTLLLIDKDRAKPGKGEVYIASPTLEY